MKKYNVFKLYVIKNEGISYLCEKTNEKYIDIFFKEEVESNGEVKYLASFYMVETMRNLARGEEFFLSEKELLIKFASLNASMFYIDKMNKFPNNVITYQEDYLEAFKELKEKKPDIAKLVAEEEIKKLRFK